MADAGADILVPHMGLTTGGRIGAQTAITLDDAVARGAAMHDAARVNRRARAVPRRSDRRTGGCGLRAGPDHQDRRLLRCVQHGAAPHRAGDQGEHGAVQVFAGVTFCPASRGKGDRIAHGRPRRDPRHQGHRVRLPAGPRAGARRGRAPGGCRGLGSRGSSRTSPARRWPRRPARTCRLAAADDRGEATRPWRGARR